MAGKTQKSMPPSAVQNHWQPDSIAPAPPGGDIRPQVPTGTAGADAVLCEKYRELVHRHLNRLPGLFTKFTGLFAHLVWAPIWPCRWSARDLPTHSRLCRHAMANRTKVEARCQECARHHLAKTLELERAGHQFTCFLGVRNFWLPVILRGCLIGLAFVQALSLPATGTPVRQQPLRPMRAPAAKSSSRTSRQGGHESKRVSRSEFSEAARLLQLVVHHVETSALADLRKSDLTQAQQALAELQTVATRLRVELNGLVPAFSKKGPVLQSEKHWEQTVRAALAHIHAGYSHPLTLKQCAEQLGLNAAYLSALFSRSVGVPFKTYLTDLRIEKARELLSDPARSVSDVAFSVGYSSENRFRLAFKHVTGLAPLLWRETLRMPSQQPAATRSQ